MKSYKIQTFYLSKILLIIGLACYLFFSIVGTFLHNHSIELSTKVIHNNICNKTNNCTKYNSHNNQNNHNNNKKHVCHICFFNMIIPGIILSFFVILLNFLLFFNKLYFKVKHFISCQYSPFIYLRAPPFSPS